MDMGNTNYTYDLQQHHTAFIKFLDDMNGLKSENDPSIQSILKSLCSSLEIAKIDVHFYENRARESALQGEYMCLFSLPEEEIGKLAVQHRYVTGNESIALYQVYPLANNSEWADVQRKEIDTLIDTIFAYHGRIRTTRMAEQYMYEDVDFGLHNFRYFMRAVGQKIEQNLIKKYVACVYNMKRMTVINELIGREKSTQMMIRYAKQLEQIIGPDGCVCHLGGDNFVTLFRQDVLDEVRKYFKGTAFVYDEATNANITMSVTAGFNVISNIETVSRPSDVMEGAYVSLNLAKSISNTDEIFWDNEVETKQLHLKKIENIFPIALQNEEFQVYYQPKVSIKNEYAIVGAEALCRWVHLDQMIYPNDFIPILEQSANICKLDFYMLDHVCRDIRRWINEGKTIVKISVNFSRKHFTDHDLLNHIVKIIDNYNVPHEYIEIELTETTTDVNFKDLKRIVNGLHEFGISTSVDDFGIGYSSLNLIRDIPWDVLKVDKSFLPELNDISNVTAKKNIVLKHVLSLARELGLECIVEGIETEDHIQLLKDNECDLAQGFYFDKPLPCEVFESKLRK